MALFIVRHQHDAKRCPAADPATGAKLLDYLSPSNARQHGIDIKGEAVVQGEHTLYVILESSDANRVREFMQPFASAGTVAIFPASSCADVVAGGGCDAPTTELHDAPQTVDPEVACQQALEAGLLVLREHPLNCETSIPALVGGVVMPNSRFYVRNHFPIPRLDASKWRLNVEGLVERQLSLNLSDLKAMRSETRVVTLECAGNGRTLLDPPVEGEKWQLGAVSTAEWTGVPLIEVLDRAGVKPAACEVLFRGADRGSLLGNDNVIHFERSLSLENARAGEVLLAYAMNGEPLPVHHGFPLRVVLPGWYAVTSVKWLTDIELIEQPFAGHYQAGAYFYEWQREGGGTVREPVTFQRVRSLIVEPHADSEVRRGEVAIRGVAWSGVAPIARVEVSIGDGPWRTARMIGERNQHAWQRWELVEQISATGPTTIRARATDLAGRTQPETAEWNRLGYGNNSIQTVSILIM